MENKKEEAIEEQFVIAWTLYNRTFAALIEVLFLGNTLFFLYVSLLFTVLLCAIFLPFRMESTVCFCFLCVMYFPLFPQFQGITSSFWFPTANLDYFNYFVGCCLTACFVFLKSFQIFWYQSSILEFIICILIWLHVIVLGLFVYAAIEFVTEKQKKQAFDRFLLQEAKPPKRPTKYLWRIKNKIE